jgi:hypothetical protein
MKKCGGIFFKKKVGKAKSKVKFSTNSILKK